VEEMHERQSFPTNRQMHRKLRAVDSETGAKAAHGCALTREHIVASRQALCNGFSFVPGNGFSSVPGQTSAKKFAECELPHTSPAANRAGCSSGLSAIGGPMTFEGEPGVCDICKAGRLIREVETIRFRQMSDKGFVNCRADVVTYTCDACHTKTIDPAAKSAFDEAFKREYDKLP
jgi:hypothetical protein